MTIFKIQELALAPPATPPDAHTHRNTDVRGVIIVFWPILHQLWNIFNPLCMRSAYRTTQNANNSTE